jgi:uncharacterized protein (TIGR02246 family)
MTRFHMIVFFILLLSLIVGCARPIARDTRAEDENVIGELETEASKAAAAKDLESLIALYADNASLFFANAPAITGKDAIRETWQTAFAQSGYGLSVQPVKVEAARSGDLAYVHGTYETTVNGANGKPVTDKGKYVVIYKKQADGKWKAILDISNSNLPAPGSAPK